MEIEIMFQQINKFLDGHTGEIVIVDLSKFFLSVCCFFLFLFFLIIFQARKKHQLFCFGILSSSRLNKKWWLSLWSKMKPKA